MKRQTAVQWLVNQFIAGAMDSGNGGNMHITFPKSALNKAKAMEKEQIQDAFFTGRYLYNDCDDSSEQYYNKTYGGNK